MTTLTASEVVAKLRERFASGNDMPVPDVRLTRAEFDVIADLLEADEKAVPVAYAEFADNGCVRMWSRGYEERLPGTRMVPLYTHSAPSDADRLAEALRWIMRTAGDAKEPCGGDPESPAAIRNGVLASISQAAAQSLGIVQGPSLAARTPWTEGEKAHFKAAAELVAQREATQAQPPAASVQDAKDAARYRWLRDFAKSEAWDYLGTLGPGDIDTEIDAAMSELSGR